MTREEPRRWDWWLAGCAALAAVLLAVDVAAYVSDDAVAARASMPSPRATAVSTPADSAVHVPSSWVPVPSAGRALPTRAT